MITVLTGGSGGAKFVSGLAQVVNPAKLTCIVNTGDDLEWWGLHVCPDVDSITYALAGMLSRERGWGVEGDTFHCLEQMQRMGAPTWFQLGDRDLALHLRRTELLRGGTILSSATRSLCMTLRVGSTVLPMTNDRVETRVETEIGDLSFQVYFVRERHQPVVRQVQFVGAQVARPAPGVLEAITSADAILLAPSNPITSIGPILAVPGIREALLRTTAPIGAVSPLIGGAAVTGPAGALMHAAGLPVSLSGLARVYGFLDVLIADSADQQDAATVEQLGVSVRFTNTLMKTDADKKALAHAALQFTRKAEKRMGAAP